MTAPTIHELTPMLPVPDVAAAARFFEERLGFEVLFVFAEPGMPGYASVQRDCVTVSFLEGTLDAAPGAKGGVNLVVDDVDAMFAEFQRRGALSDSFPTAYDAVREHPPEDKPYGMRDFFFLDPHGYTIVVGTPLDSDE